MSTDEPAILTNEDVLARTPLSTLFLSSDFWGNPIGLEGSHKSYRPLITASFRIQFVVHGFKAAWFHGVNVAIHVANSILVWKLAKVLGILENGLCLFSSLLFACHPITTEAVCSVVGRTDLLATTFTLLALIFHISTPTCSWRNVLFAVLAVCSKETGVVLLPLIALYDVLAKVNFLTGKLKVHRNIATEFLAFGAICYARLAINNFQSPQFSKNDNPIAHDPNWLTRTLTFLYLPVFHASLLVFPKTLSFDWSMDAIPKVESIFDSRFLGATICYTIGAAVVWKTWKTLVCNWKSGNSNEIEKVAFLLALLSMPHLISSNLIAYVGFVAAERILYLPAVAYCILIGYGAQLVYKRFPGIPIILVALLSVHTHRTLARVNDWKNEESLFKSSLEVNPTRAHMNIGYVYTTRKMYDLAKYHYLQALRRRPNLADAWYNLGILTSQSSNGSSAEAVHYYQQAIKSRSNFAAAHLNLALLLWDMGHHQTAFNHLEKCLTVSGENLKSYRNHLKTKATCAFNKGRFLQKSEKFNEAINALKLALEIAGAHFEHYNSVLNSIGTCYSSLGDELEAEKYFEQAINKNHVNSYLTMAHLRIRQNRSYEVEELFSKLMTLAPESVTVLQNIALAEFHMKNFNRSLIFYQKALAVDANHLDSLRGIANLLQETQRHLEAEHYYRRVVHVQPGAYESHANLGAILHLNQKYKEALKSYDMALALNPEDMISRENREKLIRVMKNKMNM
uniref:dolichyl-phosphate-mannose--protein mannosyltransferase n=1 Tax=Caenorhabditis japonica TaxID=281687 RepID=A0A8R1DIB9_CAEJA